MQRALDKFEQLISESQLSACILGNLQTSDFELVALAGDVDTPDAHASRTARGLCFVGCLGLVGGEFRSVLDVPVDAATATALARAFVEFVAAKLAAASKGDAVAWLQRLHNLPDNRREEN